MVEVIEIDDSPPLRPITNFTNSRPSTRDTTTNSWPTDDLDDDFTLTWAEKPTKKRKVTSEVIFETQESLDDVGVPVPSLKADDRITLRKTTIAGIGSYWDSDDDDSFRFTSSRVQKIIAKGKGDAVPKPVPFDGEDSDNAIDVLDFLNSSQRVDIQVSDRTAGILAKVSKNAKAGTTIKSKRITKDPTKASPKRPKSCSARIASIEPADDEPPSSQPTPKKKGRLTEAEREARAKERQAIKESREKEKAAEKERKRLVREEQSKEKQLADDVAAVNKLKLNRKETSADMILDLSTSLYEARLGSKLQQYMLRLEVQCTSFTSPMPDIVKWRRNAYREWNEESNRWSPRPHHILEEDNVLCYLPAKSFNELVSADSSDPAAENLDTHVLKLKSAYPNRKLIYLIEGLRTLIGNARNAQNREHQALVLQQIPGSQESQPTARKRKPTAVLSEDAIEAALVSLQLTHQVLIHHANSTDDSAEWIMHFTQHISTLESKNERQQLNLGTTFCMEAGQVKTGEDPRDTWVKMLQEVRGLKASAAYGIADRWENVNRLVRGFREKGPLMVENVKKSANTYGGSSDTRLGPSISRRLHSIFTSMDPDCTDI